MTKTKEANKNYATQILWEVIDKYHKGNCAACARHMGTTNQRLCYILSTAKKITPTLGAKLRYSYPEEKFSWNYLMIPYDVECKTSLEKLSKNG